MTSIAEQADRYALYEVAVQQPAVMVEFIEKDARPGRTRTRGRG